VEEIKRRGHGKDYDCIIGVSGGVDSSFVAINVKELGLRPLAVHVDNGWNFRKGGREHQADPRSLAHRFVHGGPQLEGVPGTSAGVLARFHSDSEIPSDHAIVASFYNATGKHHVGYYLSGINFRTEGIHVREWSQGHLDRRYIQTIYKRFTGKAAEAFPAHSGTDAGAQYRDASPEGRLSARLSGLRQAVGKTNVIDKYGWEDYGGKHYESMYTRFYQGWILPHKFGYDKRRMHLSTLICQRANHA